jgi:transposase InsO family protein
VLLERGELTTPLDKVSCPARGHDRSGHGWRCLPHDVQSCTWAWRYQALRKRQSHLVALGQGERRRVSRRRAPRTRLRVLRVYDHLNQKTAIQFIDYMFEKLPFRVEVIQTDNGAEFQSAFHWHVLDRGVHHVYIKPATPRLNGKVERSHRIDADEFYRLLDGLVLDDARLFTTKLQEWEDFYNFDRPHGGLGGQTPYERLRQKTGALV